MNERIKKYDPIESDIEFRKMAKEIAENYRCYFELILESDGGAYKLVSKFEMKNK